jgi:flavin-dependent dehydrogenase
MVDCDVTICGAGIAGLLMASELSKLYSVVVLEKAQRSQCSNKFWLTRRECLEINPDLAACVDSEWNELDFIANSRSKYTVRGRYILWNTKKLESYLVETIEANGSRLLYQHRFFSYGQTDNHVIAYANDSAFRSRLLIDCMGYSSSIVSATRAVSMLGYQHLFGQTMQLKCPISPIAADNVLLSGSPSFLEVFPKSDGTANVVLISPAKTAGSLSTLARDFRFIVNNTHYSNILAPLPNAAPLYGVVPIGRVRKRALDRMLFFGEAGQTHPAASCTCLNKLLFGFREAADRVSQRIESNRLKAKDLEDVMPHMRKFAQRFHQNLFRQLGTWTSDQGEALVDLLRCLDQKSLDDLIFGEIGPNHFMQVNNWKRVIRTRNTVWVKPLLQTMFNL